MAKKSKTPLIPSEYQAEFDASQTSLIRSRVFLFCALTVVLYFAATLFNLILYPGEFRVQEIPLWGALSAGALIVLFFNRRAQTIRQAKRNAYWFTGLLLLILTKIGLIYAAYAEYSMPLYTMVQFFVCLIIPWTSREVLLIALLHVVAYDVMFFNSQAFISPRSASHHGVWLYIDGLLLLFLSTTICYVIRRKEMGRDIQNFVLLKQVEKQNKQLTGEEEVARLVQGTLVPENVTTDKVDVYVTYLPMLYVGGDYAQVNFVDKHRLLFLISDVTGHGVGPALLVNRLHAEFERHSKKGNEPGQLLAKLNEFIRKEFVGTDMYMSAFCGLIDLRRKQLSYSNYGHPPQYLIKGKSGELEALEAHTTWMGLRAVNGTSFQSQTNIRRGDRLMLFTDGIIEARNATGLIYGPERMQNYLKRNRDAESKTLHEGLLSDLREFSNAEFKDDIFMLDLKLK